MRILYLEILVLFFSFIGVSLEDSEDEVEVTPRKASQSISYTDLQKFSLDSENITGNSVYFDHNPQAQPSKSYIDFENEMKAAYRDKQEVKVHINELIRLLRKGIINEAQATLIWEYFTESDKTQHNRNRNIKEEKLSLVGLGVFKIRDVLDGFLAIILVAVLVGALCFLFLIISLALYDRKLFVLNLAIAGLFVYNFKFIADDLCIVLDSKVLSSLVYNTNLVILAYCIHFLFYRFKLHGELAGWTDLIYSANNFNGRLIYISLLTVLAYIHAHQLDYFLIQVPFYLGWIFLCSLLGVKFGSQLPSFLQPFYIFLMSIWSILLLVYLQHQGSNAFLLSNDAYEQVQKAWKLEDEIIRPDFQFTGYLFASTILLVVCPLYLFIQHQDLGKAHLSRDFTFSKVFGLLKAIQTQPMFSKDYGVRSFWLLAYGILALLVLYIGFRARVCYIIVLTILGLQSFIGIYSKEKGVFSQLFFYSTGFITVNATFLMGKIDDTFSGQVLSIHALLVTNM